MYVDVLVTFTVWHLTCGKVRLDGSVADPHHFDPDPDPAFYFDADPDPIVHSYADPDPTFSLMWIRMRILPLTFFQIWTLQCSKMILKGFHNFTLMRIAILLYTLMRIRIHFSILMRMQIRIRFPK
jgi:hypothetical protein